jgi:hypothetical protein
VPPTIRQPLTGEPLESEDEILQRPALVAKIDNNAAAVPNHSGLAVADIVFEEVVEGRTTRFAAVFHSQSSDPIGPIRSGAPRTSTCSRRSTSRCSCGAAATRTSPARSTTRS